jgi:nucleoside triphosphate diphosphatase
MPGIAGGIEQLQVLVSRLRAPDGCPWDREQTARDLRAYLLEEAHEVAAAIDTGDWGDLQGELGDLLFQIVFLAALAEEAGAFDLAAVIATIHAKMVARHPHVFGGSAAVADAEAVRAAWERRKLRDGGATGSLLDGVALSLPALVASYRLTQKASGVGFDWPDAEGVFAKLDEELAELRVAVASAAAAGPNASPKNGIREEVGDLLFTLANLARKLGVDPEGALAETNLKFRRRFAAVESGLVAAGRPLSEATLAEMDALWQAAKTTVSE